MAGLSLSLLVVAGLVTWHALATRTYVAPRPHDTTVATRPDGAALTLQELTTAIRHHDVAAARRLAATGDRHAARLLAGIVENARAARVGDLSLRYVDEESGADAQGAWPAAVDTEWRFTGYDHAPANTEVTFTFVAETHDRVGIRAIGGGGHRTPVWLTGPLQVRHGPRTLVLVAGSRHAADAYERRARTALRVVHRVLPHWRGSLVLEVPATEPQMAQALGATPVTYDNIAAVTAPVDGSVAPGTPVHVFVNPQVFDRLEPAGAQVVISHESTHVATGAATSSMAPWLQEGFADYVALRDVHLPVSVTAKHVIALVRQDGPPSHLPGSVEFDTRARHLEAAYEGAWQANVLLAQDGGQAALVRFYRAVAGGTSVNTALEHGFGLSLASFTHQWQQRLGHLR